MQNQDYDTRPVAKHNTYTRQCTTRPDDEIESGQDEYYTLATRRIYTYVSVLKSIVQPNTL